MMRAGSSSICGSSFVVAVTAVTICTKYIGRQAPGRSRQRCSEISKISVVAAVGGVDILIRVTALAVGWTGCCVSAATVVAVELGLLAVSSCTWRTPLPPGRLRQQSRLKCPCLPHVWHLPVGRPPFLGSASLLWAFRPCSSLCCLGPCPCPSSPSRLPSCPSMAAA